MLQEGTSDSRPHAVLVVKLFDYHLEGKEPSLPPGLVFLWLSSPHGDPNNEITEDAPVPFDIKGTRYFNFGDGDQIEPWTIHVKNELFDFVTEDDSNRVLTKYKKAYSKACNHHSKGILKDTMG